MLSGSMSLSNLLHLSYESQYGIREVIEMFVANATLSVGRNTSLTILDSILYHVFYDDVFAYFSITMKCGDERRE